MDTQANAALKRAIGMLEAILNRQIECHRSMLTLADAKRDSVLSGDLEKLEQTVAEERKLVARIEEEEDKRKAVMPMVRSGLGLGESVEKLAEVVSHMPQPERDKMMATRNTLKELLEQCQLKNRHNAELLKASLEHVESFLRTVSEAAAPDVGYRKDGKRSGGGPTLIDRSA